MNRFVGPPLKLQQAEALGRDLPLPELCLRAAQVRDQGYGRRLTYSPKVFIPLTELCRDVCHYCTFAKTPSQLGAPFLELEEVLAIAREGKAAGCHEALFTLGEKPELRYRQAREWLAARGYQTTVDYLADAARAVLEQTGLVPHINAGTLSRGELRKLRRQAPLAALCDAGARGPGTHPHDHGTAGRYR